MRDELAILEARARRFKKAMETDGYTGLAEAVLDEWSSFPMASSDGEARARRAGILRGAFYAAVTASHENGMSDEALLDGVLTHDVVAGRMRAQGNDPVDCGLGDVLCAVRKLVRASLATPTAEAEPSAERDRARFWEKTARRHEKDAVYYRERLVDAEAMIGRLLLQFSERWDLARITKYRSDRAEGFLEKGCPREKPE